MKCNISINKQIILFFGLTYLSSWILFFFGKTLDVMPLVLVGIWCPSIISLVLTIFIYGKRGLLKLLGRFRRVRIHWSWWLVLLLLPLFIHFLGRSLWELFYQGNISFEILDLPYWLSALVPSFLIAGLGEELGWRGFALPRLQQRFSPFLASFILAIIHLLWHMPTYWLGQGMHNVPFIYVLAFIIPWTFIFNWLYNRSGGSLIFAVGFHAISNTSLSLVRFLPYDKEVELSPELITMTSLPINLSGPYLSVCAVYVIVALIIVFKGKFGKVNTDIP